MVAKKTKKRKKKIKTGEDFLRVKYPKETKGG